MAKKNNWLIPAAIIIIAIIFFMNRDGGLFAITGVSSVNLLANPGFETQDASIINTPAYWSTSAPSHAWSVPSSNYAITLDSAIKHSGNYSVHLHANPNSTKSWFSVGNIQVIKTSPGKKYQVTMWMKTANLPVGCYPDQANASLPNYCAYSDRVMLEMQGWNSSITSGRTSANGIIGFYPAKTPSIRNSDWTQYTAVYTVPANTDNIFPKLFLYSTGGDVWYDDISINEFVTNEATYLDNPDAEIWTITACNSTRSSYCYNVPYRWTVAYNASAFQSSNAQSGLYSLGVLPLQVDTNNPVWAGIATVPLAQGKKYGFSGYVKSSQKITLNIYDSTTNTLLTNAVSTGNGNWEKLSAQFVAASTGNYKFAFSASTANVPYYVDNLELFSLENASTCTTINDCTSNADCKFGYCVNLICAPGYSPSNHLCVQNEQNIDTNPKSCNAVFSNTLNFFDFTSDSCTNGYISLVIIVAIGIILLNVFKKR